MRSFFQGTRAIVNLDASKLIDLRFRHAHLNSRSERRGIRGYDFHQRRHAIHQGNRASAQMRAHPDNRLHREIGDVNRSEGHERVFSSCLSSDGRRCPSFQANQRGPIAR
jgi:hypothetical protein